MTHFYLPPELINIIKEYSMPLTKPDYKLGSFMIRSLVSNNDVISKSIFEIYINLCSSDISDIKSYADVLNNGD